MNLQGVLIPMRPADEKLNAYHDPSIVKELIQAEERFSKAFHANPSAISISSLEDGRFIDVNESFLRITGYSREEILNHTSAELNLWADQKDRAAVVQRLHEKGHLHNMEGKFRTKLGEIRVALFSIELIEIDGKTCILKLAHDITERKRSEEALLKLSSAVEQTADNVIITDREGIIEYVNPAFEKITGYSRDEVTGRTPRLLKSGKHDQAFYEKVWNTILSGNTYRDDFINRKKNGDLYYEEKTITPIKNAEGQITHFVSTGKDITERVQAFNELEQRVEERTREIQQLYTQTEQARRGLAALYRADEYLYRHLRLDQVLQALVDVVIDILDADKASVQVWDEERGRLVVRAARNYSPEMIAMMSGYVPGDGISGTVFQTGEPVAVEDARFANPPANTIATAEGIYSVLSVPLKIGDKIFGVFGMDYCQPRSFSDEDKRLFKALAQRAARAIENARLYEQAEQAAALEERQRLARELHDSITQSLYSLMLMAGAGRRLSESGELEAAKDQIIRIGETAQQALKEMRLMVYEMRPLALHTVGLIEALQQRLDAVEKRAGIQTHLQVQGQINLPARVEEELYRIAQEALNNALKHAAATITQVELNANGEYVSLEVSDNGKGFDLDDTGQLRGIGLDSMRERAKYLLANLVIKSTLGEGTTVRVEVKLPFVALENSLKQEVWYE